MRSTKVKPMLEKVLRRFHRRAYQPVPATWSCLPLSAALQPAGKNSTIYGTHIFYNRRRPLNPNWTGHTMIDGGTRTVDVSWKPVLNRNSSEDGHCGGSGAASSGLCTGYSSPLYWVLFSLTFIHRLSWLINLSVGVVGEGKNAHTYFSVKKSFLIIIESTETF